MPFGIILFRIFIPVNSGQIICSRFNPQINKAFTGIVCRKPVDILFIIRIIYRTTGQTIYRYSIIAENLSSGECVRFEANYVKVLLAKKRTRN